jgi:hypothetical protein
MTPQTPDMQAVLERLETLERQNCRRNAIGIAALTVIGALMLMGQSKPQDRVLDAGTFILRDANGNVRLRIGMNRGWPGLSFYDADARERAAFGSFGLALQDDKGQDRIDLVGSEELGPSLKLSDSQGYSTVVGKAQLIEPGTGETHETSASSLVMFGKNRNVIWRAP